MVIDMKIAGLNQIGEALKQRRMALSLSQDALAEKSGITQAQISGIERGGRNARIGTVTMIARTLGLEMMFVPREKQPAVQFLLAEKFEDEGEHPLYALEDED